MPDYAEKLLAEIAASPEWPLARETYARDMVARRRAFRKSDQPALQAIAGWEDDRNYVVDPLSKKACTSFADFLFGQPPRYAAQEGYDQTELDRLASNDLTKGFWRAERMVYGEGEAYWKAHTNREIAEVPLVDWYSRLEVVPLFYGERLMAVAFVREVGRKSSTDEDVADKIYRHFEVHGKGRVLNALFIGTTESVGESLDLSTHAETEDLIEDWKHGLPMLAGRVVNELDDDPHLGECDFDNVDGLCLLLNESLTISGENARNTGKQRVYGTSDLVKDGRIDPGFDYYQVDETDAKMGDGRTAPPVEVVDLKYDAEALWHHHTKLTAVTLSRVGLVAQWIGENVEGQGDSGLAIRLRFLPTINAAESKANEWDAALPLIVHAMQKIAALTEPDGGFGWTDPGDKPPVIERAEALPADEADVVQTNVMAYAAGIRSLYLAVKSQMPHAPEEEIDAEMARIIADEKASMAAAFDGPPTPSGEDPPADS